MDGMPIDRAVAEAARRCLAAHHPVTVADLVELLAQEGVRAPEGEDPLRWVGRHLDATWGDRSFTWDLPDRRLIDVDELYEGLVLTHHVMATELTTSVVDVEPDLIPLVLIDQVDDPEDDDAYVVLAAGGRAELGHFCANDELALAGPPGWLGNAPIGDLLAFQVTKGELSVTRVAEEPALAEDAVQALRSAYEQACQTGAAHEGAVQVLDVFALALAENPSLFREPLPPLRDLLTAAGLAVSGKWVRGLAAASQKDLGAADELAVAALQIVVEAYRLGLSRGPATVEELGLTPAGLARMLSCRWVAPTFADEMIQLNGVLQVTGFGWALQGAHPWNAGPHLVLAICAEAQGDTLAAEAHVAEALRADPCHKDSLLHAAWYAEDRGDTARTLGYLRQADADDSPHARFLEGFAAPGPATGAAEEPCLCGSGRTHGLCCAHRNGHPLHERVGWLYRKAVRYLLRPAPQLAIRAIAEARIPDDPRPLAWKRAALLDPLTQDLGLFECGVLEEFLDVRGVLLPADELALGRCWVGIRRGLYEVTAVQRADRRLGLRDLATGDRLDVPEEGGVRYVPGLVVYARVGTDGRAPRILDALPIPTNLREGMLDLLGRDPDPVEVVTWIWTHNGSRGEPLG
ncbi:MAG: hypothetical protein ACRDZ4_03265 [Egibacteraceae bacterium]